jgi:hypothetical protein
MGCQRESHRAGQGDGVQRQHDALYWHPHRFQRLVPIRPNVIPLVNEGGHRGPVELPSRLLDWPTHDRRDVPPEEGIGLGDIAVKKVI